MRSFPIAGRLLEQKFLFGLSLKHLEVLAIPFAFMVIPEFLGVPTMYYLWLGLVGLIFAGLVLYYTPPVQRPREWVIGWFHINYGTTTYLNRPTERGRARGKVQDGVLSYEDSWNADSEGE